ncbi:hypothetical protein GDO86_015312 [Hymenochirus boettgeri]|uniref:SprT-like domain-containing protein n=1 Tax=Hymenochirus boettgeri TaxID=247094 RepID=A0A8T2JWY7_9PIPI|nr:hypothetical protein GDO86_015312 [Hymenochirus boettgeri]
MTSECYSLIERISARMTTGGQTAMEPLQQRKKLLADKKGKLTSPEPKGADCLLFRPCTEKLNLSDTEDDGKHEQVLHFDLKENQITSNKSFSGIQEKPRSVVVISDSSDEDFENFLITLKTPKPVSTKGKGNNSVKDFIVDSDEDDFASVFSQNSNRLRVKNGVKNSIRNVSPATYRDLTSQKGFDSPVFISNSDDDDSIVIKSTWNSRNKGQSKTKLCSGSKAKEELPSNTFFRKEEKRNHKVTHKSNLSTSGSSDEEFESLMERIKNRTKSQTPSSTASKTNRPHTTGTEPTKVSCLDLINQKENGLGRKAKSQSTEPTSPYFSSERVLTEVLDPADRPRSDSVKFLCKVPDCFLQDLSCPKSLYMKNFKQKKEELTSRLYNLYNHTVFEQKLPETMEIIWNKKMRKTAGYCVTGQKRQLGVQRYARIELSEKVCDSAGIFSSFDMLTFQGIAKELRGGAIWDIRWPNKCKTHAT